MYRSREVRRTGRMLAWSSAAVLVAGSLGFTAPAFAAQPEQPGHSAPGRDHATSTEAGSAHGQAHKRAVRHEHTAAPAGSGDHGSAVSLPRPNDFQAQADPDGAANGGVDQPGGTGGVDTTTQDGNNGSGNDTDCEDDNRGVGVPGHCKDRPEPSAPPVDEAPTPEGDVPGTPELGGGSAAFAPDNPSDSTGVEVLAPKASAPNASPARSSATVLPQTGAGQALLGLAVAALAALAVGLGLVRRSARVTS
jgi:LPXTG-motif cell wall-anchored protein